MEASLQMPTYFDMEDNMAEMGNYCNGASHNRIRAQLPVQADINKFTDINMFLFNKVNIIC